MKFSLIIGIFLIGGLLLAAATMADRETSDNGLNGTWTDANYSFTLVQDGSAVMLTGIPFDEESVFPLILTGMLSDNNTRLVTNKNMTDDNEIPLYL